MYAFTGSFTAKGLYLVRSAVVLIINRVFTFLLMFCSGTIKMIVYCDLKFPSRMIMTLAVTECCYSEDEAHNS